MLAIVRVLTDAVQSACIAYCSPGRFQELESFESFAVYAYDREGGRYVVSRRQTRRFRKGVRSTYFCSGGRR